MIKLRVELNAVAGDCARFFEVSAIWNVDWHWS